MILFCIPPVRCRENGKEIMNMVDNWARQPVLVKKVEMKRQQVSLTCWVGVISWSCAQQAEAADTPDEQIEGVIHYLKRSISCSMAQA